MRGRDFVFSKVEHTKVFLEQIELIKRVIHLFCKSLSVVLCSHVLSPLTLRKKRDGMLNFHVHLKVKISHALEFKGYGKLTCVGR